MKIFVILFILISIYKLTNGQLLKEVVNPKNLVIKPDDMREQYGRPPPYMGRQPYGQNPYGQQQYGQNPYNQQRYNPYGGGYGGNGRGYGRYDRWTTTTLGFPFNLFGKK